MYGQPPFCKRKRGRRNWSARMYPAFDGVAISWPEWNALRPRPFYFRCLGGQFRFTGFRERRDRPFCHFIVRQQTWQESQTSEPSSLVCRCGNRVSDFQAWRVGQASSAGHQATTDSGKSGGRYASPLNRTAQTMRAILLATATTATCLRLRATRLASHVLRPDRKSTRLNSSHSGESRMPSSA